MTVEKTLIKEFELLIDYVRRELTLFHPEVTELEKSVIIGPAEKALEGYKAASSNTGDGLRWVNEEIKKKMNGYFDKSFKAQQRIDKGDKNAGVLEKCEKEYSARGLELSWVLELLKKAETNPVDNIVEREEKNYEPEVRNTNEADVASHSCTNDNSIRLLSALLSGKTLFRISHNEHKQTLYCEWFNDKPYFYVQGWGSAYGNGMDRVIGIIETNGAEWSIELPNDAVSDTTEADSSNDAGNKKIPSIDWDKVKVDYLDKNPQEACMAINLLFNWLKNNLQGTIDWEGLENVFYDEFLKRKKTSYGLIDIFSWLKTKLHDYIK